MYDWKSVKRSSNPMNALRNFTKKFIIYGPDLDVQTLNFFVKKVNGYPKYYSDQVKDEVGLAFDNCKSISEPQQNTHFITNHTRVHEDKSFLNKLAGMLKSCKKPCNYFKPMSSSIGTLADFGQALSNSASILGSAGSDLLHAPTNIATDLCNKIKPMVRTEFFKLKILTQDLYRDGVKPFFSKADKQRVDDKLAQGLTPDKTFERLPLTGDTQTFFMVSQVHSEVLSKIQENLGDCFRMFEYNQRYNPYDPEMNAAFAKRKYMGLKNGNVMSLIDVTGSLAPAQYATENTYANALDVPISNEHLMTDDARIAPKYDKYDGPSKGSEQVITAGHGSTGDPIAASGSKAVAPQAGVGLENIPSNGSVFDYNFGEVKITAYGYPADECPDSGSEIGLGNKNNMIIPLKTVAINPENLPPTKSCPNGNSRFKPGDVLLITCTDKNGNVWKERRQVGDSTGAGIAAKGGYKLIIDEFLPSKHGSKMQSIAEKSSKNGANIKLSIQVADTKEPLAKWNPQEASQFAPMFVCRTDWLRVLKQGPTQSSGFVKAKMYNEYKAYVKWSDGDPIKQRIIDSKGC